MEVTLTFIIGVIGLAIAALIRWVSATYFKGKDITIEVRSGGKSKSITVASNVTSADLIKVIEAVTKPTAQAQDAPQGRAVEPGAAADGPHE